MALFGALSAVFALFITRFLVEQPGFTDAFYHFNAAKQLITGHGLTDEYLWVYIGMPERLPAPSHLYWMPFTSISAALGMALFGVSYAGAQIPFAFMYAGAACVAFWWGWRLGGSHRHAWMAGLLTLLSGFFLRYWGATDTFAPYALVGSLCLTFMGLGADSQRPWLYYALCGVMAALAHLTRADGVLLLLVAWVVILWSSPHALRKVILYGGIVTLAYLVVMLPWFVRNYAAIGSPLPVGGAQGIWYTEYNDLFNYPPDANPQTLFANGAGTFISSRWDGLTNTNGGALFTLIAVEGMIVVTPFMLLGLWKRRTQPFLRGFWLYALGLHLAMSVVFPFPGMRGGLFHSAAALLPGWMALGVAGLDDALEWAARRRRWNASTAKIIFSAALVFFVAFLSLTLALPRRVQVATPALYTALAEQLPPDARVMINDPAALFYFTGLGGVVLPNEPPEAILEIAARYDVDYLLLEASRNADGDVSLAASEKLASLLDAPPDFLTAIPLNVQGVLLYAIEHEIV
jgi:4-amino-4-deoxy-L-arabinose transferase-like glycosyltransferase